MKTRKILSLVLAGLTGLALTAAFAAAQRSSDPAFKVKIDFNRWHDVGELAADMKRLQAAFPKFLKLESIGKSFGGRDLWLMTVNNPDTGPEIGQGGHVHRGQRPRQRDPGRRGLPLHDLVPDGELRPHRRRHPARRRARLLHHPDGQPRRAGVLHGRARRERALGPRPGRRRQRRPRRRGRARGPQRQRRSSSRSGSTCPARAATAISRTDPLILEPVPFGETGDWIMLGQEGIDNDGDGLVNEDGPGSYDPNRNWGSDWQPNYIQGGAMDYPFQLPEARAVNDFLMAPPQHRRRPDLPQHRRHDPPRAGRRVDGGVSDGRRPGLRRARPERRAHAALLPLHRHLERALHGPRRVHRLDQRRAGHPLVLERAVERRAVLHEPGPQGRNRPIRRAPSPRACRATSSTSTSSSATSTSSGSPSTIPSSARSRWEASGRSSRAGYRPAS